jgi:hypothetical protein
MSVVKIILILGLIYVAMNQKVEKTRNMLLIVTGLLAFCMFSVEGIQVIPSGTCTERAQTSVATDATACAAVTELDTATACEAVMTASATQACTYTAGTPRDVQNDDLDDLFSGCTEGKKIKDTIPPTGAICEDIPAPAPAPAPAITSFQGCAAGKKIKDPIPPTGAICEDIPEDDSICSIM